MPKGAPKAKELFAELAGPGPHQVMRGELAITGLRGTLFTPRAGLGLPAVVFASGWLQPPARYRNLLHHLASWGIVAVCPTGHASTPLSFQPQADDLKTTLDICLGVRFGTGEISVDPAKLGLAGHSTGGGSAVLAAAADPARVRAVATLAASEVRPSAVEAAAGCPMPGLHLAAGKDLIAPPVGHAEAIAAAWQGPVTVRTLRKATHLAFTQGVHWSELLLDGKPAMSARRAARAMLTGFFLYHLTGAKRWGALLDADLKSCPITYTRPALRTPRTTRAA